MSVPTLRTQRLVLRALEHKYLDEVVRCAGNYEISQWLVVVPYPYTWSDAEAFLQMDLAGDLSDLWAITKEGAFIGVVSTGEGLGYWLEPSCWGRAL
ncbi:GNAT family N-acetyltransferase [Yoonia maritima]|uniref:GNAT family N-acetyltransferase n=1 Tax=Yoonia maritima TaxID=1435347 RepID=UPI0013A61EE0|nr:GNAT family N-acetyltransferase [Yoonia maritima]